MDKLEAVLTRIQSMVRQVGSPTCSVEKTYRCAKCQDRELVDRGDGIYTFCECRQQRIIERRIKSSMVNPAFMKATLDNYRPAPHTAAMLAAARDYVEHFQTLRSEPHNGLALVAKVGESAIQSVRDPAKRLQLKAQHNSYGLGKTHLLSAVALILLKQGVQVLMVNDTDIMAEMRQAQLENDASRFEKLIHSIEEVELLIWDDLGKAKTTEWVLNQYYRIINYRYRMGLPICLSTNEDMESLSDKIGDATASRLSAICRGRLITCEGPDYRMT